MNDAFVHWGYCFELHAGEIRLDRMIFVIKVLDEACRVTLMTAATPEVLRLRRRLHREAPAR